MEPVLAGASIVPAMPAAEAETTAAPIRWALYLFLVSLPFEMPQRTIPAEIPTLVGALFLGVTLLQPRACYVRVPWALLWFGAFLWAFGLAAAVNGMEYPGQVARLFVVLLQLMLLLWAMSNLLHDPKTARVALLAFAGACTLRAVMQLEGFAATANVVATGGARESALGQNANQAAMMLAAGFVTLAALTYGRPRSAVRPSLLSWLPLALVGAATVRTGSRGGLAALLGGLLMVLLWGRGLRARARNFFIGIVAVGLLAAAVASSEVMRNRLLQTVETGNMAGRERIFPALRQMIEERPLLGWGPINNKYELGRRLLEPVRIRRDAHNIVLEVLTATGAVGGIPFLVGLLLVVRSAWRARRGEEGIVPLALLSTVLLANMSGNWIASKLLWLAMAYALAAGSRVSGVDGRASAPS